jgi:hypothetical protein
MGAGKLEGLKEHMIISLIQFMLACLPAKKPSSFKKNEVIS